MLDRHQLPPGPAEPFDINTNEETFEKLPQWFRQYGDLVKVNACSRKNPGYVIDHPDFVKRVLVTNHRNYAKGIGFERVKMLLGNGIIVSDGEYWRTQRRMIQPAFNKQIIAQLAEVIRKCNVILAEKWALKAEKQQEINITDETSDLALEIILRSIFGDDLDDIIASEGENPFSILAHDTARDLQLVVKFRKLARLVAGVINQRRQQGRHGVDFLSLFMQAKDKETGRSMTDKALIDEVMTLIVAGHETTAATMNWSWYLISQHPEVETKLHCEVDKLVEEEPPEFDDLGKLSYAKQIMDEALRLYPPVWIFTRKALGEDHLGGYYVPPGTDIFLCPYFVHRHTDFWSEPEKFLPERFADSAVRERHRYAYFPFSMGSRRCIGEFFATVELQIHLGFMARHFQLKYLSERPIELEPLVNLRTKHGLMMLLQKR